MSTEILRAFHDSAELKQHYLDRVRRHREADNLVQGTGWENGRGCAVGCVLEAYDHSRYPSELGIPRVLAHLEDRLFERLPRAEAMTWPERFLGAIRPGADLAPVWPRFACWLLEVELAKWRTPASDHVCALLRRSAVGDEPTEAEWIAARHAMYGAAVVAAAVAAAAVAAADAYAAVAAAAAAAADDAVAAAAVVAARTASYRRQSERLLELLAEAW